MKVEKIVLESVGVRLEPLTREHLPALGDAIRDGELWKLPVTVVPHPDDLAVFFEHAEKAFAEARELTFVTFDRTSSRLVGSTRFRCIDHGNLRVEIGFTFIAASAQRSHVNSEAKYLMLRHAFEVWNVERVELLTDFRNQKSRAAIARLGAQQEGILRSHMIMRDGYVRDSVIFSIVKREWPAVKARLEPGAA